MGNIFKRLPNFGIYLLIISLIVFGSCIVLVLFNQTYLAIAFIILAVLSFANIILSFHLTILTRQKNTLLNDIEPFFKALTEFNNMCQKIVSEQNVDDYEALFLREKTLNPEIIKVATNAKKQLIEHQLDTSRMLADWYLHPEILNYYLEANYELLKDMRKIFSRIPVELNKLRIERSV